MRQLIELFESRFESVHQSSCDLVRQIPADRLYWQPRDTDSLFPVNSCGEFVLRSAAAVESVFGGLTAKLWDDPFEWTLPEMLSTNELLIGYLEEVADTRRRGFSFLTNDADLMKQIPAPEHLRPIGGILLDSLTRAEHNLGRACGVFGVFSDAKIRR